MNISLYPMQMRMCIAGSIYRGAAEVYSYTEARFQRCQQVAIAAAEFKDPLALRRYSPIVALKQLVIIRS